VDRTLDKEKDDREILSFIFASPRRVAWREEERLI
jgi:hypothetical protein